MKPMLSSWGRSGLYIYILFNWKHYHLCQNQIGHITVLFKFIRRTATSVKFICNQTQSVLCQQVSSQPHSTKSMPHFTEVQSTPFLPESKSCCSFLQNKPLVIQNQLTFHLPAYWEWNKSNVIKADGSIAESFKPLFFHPSPLRPVGPLPIREDAGSREWYHS